MNPLSLKNSLTNVKKLFIPRRPQEIKLFTCGPSVYRFQHVGNYRTFMYEDVLQGYLEYLGYTVNRVINFTDVEDKAIQEAVKKNTSLEALRRPVEEKFLAECEMLNIRLPERIPRATTSVESAVEIIQLLLERGHAYWHDGEVFFDPLTYDGFGRIYGLDMSTWPKKKIRFRQDTYPGSRWNRGDFILWHKRSDADGEVWWDTDLGQGRPAWNIQDAAMIKKHLGFEIDMHTGGKDNLFRHHDYTLAIMEGASGKTFCPWWLHGGELKVDGEKMSKSKGNVVYVDDLLDMGFEPRHLRFFLLYNHYRDDLDLSRSCMEQCAGELDRVRNMALSLASQPEPDSDAGADIPQQLQHEFETRMNDDLDVRGAFDAIAKHVEAAFQLSRNAKLANSPRMEIEDMLKKVDSVLKVLW